MNITEIFELEADTYLGYTVQNGVVYISCNDLFVPAADGVRLPKSMNAAFAHSLLGLPLDRKRELTMMAWCCVVENLPPQNQEYADELKPYIEKFKQNNK